MYGAYTLRPHVQTPSGGDGPAQPIKPNFRNLRGQMHGYSQTSNRPNKQNIRALLRELDASLEYIYEQREATWDEALLMIERFPRFFCSYYTGSDWPTS